MGALWFLFVLSTISSSSSSSISELDAASLLSFKASVSLDPSNLLSNWVPSTDHCLWHGVTCDNSSSGVIGLAITGNLSGTLPASIGNLTHLRALSITHNAFSGDIPPNLGSLRLLETLELQGNNFSGRIPHQISHLTSLSLLNLSCNALSGSIPNRLVGFGRLGIVDLSNNLLSDGIRIDSVRCEFLTHLKLSQNFLTGSIPREMGTCRGLRSLLLDGNVLQGQIPAEIGRVSHLRILDVSRNSLTGRIPEELANCRKLSVVVLTNLVDLSSNTGYSLEDSRGEFNAFAGGIPSQILLLPDLQVFWAPRANLGGRLPNDWNESCPLRVLNLGQNYVSGVLPDNMGRCKNLSFLDLSSNRLQGSMPSRLPVPCMVYFNVSRNSLTGVIPAFQKRSCRSSVMISYKKDPNFRVEDDVSWWWCHAGSNIPVWGSQVNALNNPLVVAHDFSWNGFFGTLPQFSLGDEFFAAGHVSSYRLKLSNNNFNGSLPSELVSNCNGLLSFSVDLSANHINSAMYLKEGSPLDCSRLKDLEAAGNQISGSLGPGIANLRMLERLDLRNNRLSGHLPDQLGDSKDLKWILLGGNNLTGNISTKLGQLTSLEVLDLSKNNLTGSIPMSLTRVRGLQIVLLNHNRLFGEIPWAFSSLTTLIQLDVSFNNLSGPIPCLQHKTKCDCFKGNRYLLESCPGPYTDSSPAGLPNQLGVQNWHNGGKLKLLVVAVVTCVSVVLCVLLAVVFVLLLSRRKLRRLTSLRRKILVTFAEVPTELNYDKVVRATGNFSIRNLIGTGGFGSTYKAELVPGFLVAVKRLSIGRFQGIQQFDAEIATLGRIRHKNLVTLIGCYLGEAEVFLIYNYLSGGNLEAFIHDRSGKNAQWFVIHKIAIDIAQALAFLHYSCIPRIIHRDIKPSNILLDEDLNAYLSDFGLARLLEVSETHATTDVAGTFGYVAPEYATTCRVSDKADVYSFGVVLLELMSGKRSLDPSFFEYGNGFNIVAWAKLLMNEGRPSEFFCPELWEAGPRENLMGMLTLASNCTVDSLSVRPSMRQVVEKLKQLNA